MPDCKSGCCISKTKSEEQSVRLVHDHLTKRLKKLEVKEDNLLDLVESGGAIAAKVRDRLMAIVEERERVKNELAAQEPLLETGAARVRTALDLLDDPQEVYRQTIDPVRRHSTWSSSTGCTSTRMR
jgi:hypothetical protein